MKIELIPMRKADPDLPELKRIHASPSVSKYITISECYFEYVTTAENVVYDKIMSDGTVVGGIHTETDGGVLYLSICIDEQYRRCGIAETALRRLLSELPDGVKYAEVSIDETNSPSAALFLKLGFVQVGKEDELIVFRLKSPICDYSGI